MPTLPLNTIHRGDCLELLRQLPDNSIDSVVTDPPYGLSKEPNITEVLTNWLAGNRYEHGAVGFMGKTWDSFVPGPEIWSEVFRVLKPGGHALVFAGTRTQDLMTIALRLGGFEVRDVIEWLYWSGYPKSMDVSKQFDRRRNDLEAVYKVTTFTAEQRDKAGKSNSDIDRLFGKTGMAGHWTSRNSQPAVPTVEQWFKLKEFLNAPDDMDELVLELNGRKGTPGESWGEREVLGQTEGSDPKHSRLGFTGMTAPDGKTRRHVYDVTAPATELAQKWEGWGTSLKPAHEPIIVVRKPLIGTVAETVEQFGTGAININACRIGETVETWPKSRKYAGGNKQPLSADISGAEVQDTGSPPPGRFPANIISTDDGYWSKIGTVTPAELCKKSTPKDRNSDWKGDEIDLPERLAGGLAGRADGSLGKQTFNRNIHPTVKPLDLMAWLVRLVTPAGGVVLDPFTGSGSTLAAAKREGFDFIGAELTPEYAEIAAARTGTE